MTEEVKRRGRPAKNHLQDDHHFRTSDDIIAAGAPPAIVDSDQADTSLVDLTPDSISADPIIEVAEISPLILPDESPIERKIHQLVEKASLNGWHPIEMDAVLNSPPRNGNPIRLSEYPDKEGVIAFWKKERAFANATKRWQEHGVWRDFYTGMKIDFEPKYWKERYV